MNTWAIVALKSPQQAKSRLSTALSSAQRRAVTLTLAQHVIDTLRLTPGITQVAVVTASDEVSLFAKALGAMVLRQPRDAGTADAFKFAVREMRPYQPDAVLLMPGDLPLISSAAVKQIIEGPARHVVIVPDRHGTGTNALFCAPPAIIAPAFGAHSFQRHLAMAHAAGVPARRLDIDTLALDLDDADDLDMTLQLAAPRLIAVLRSLGIQRKREVA
jgi:2-phospho-L-lactate guanylyltransferase